MESVDRLVWAAGLSFNVLGFEAGLRVNEQAVLERALACLPGGWEPGTWSWSSVSTRSESPLRTRPEGGATTTSAMPTTSSFLAA